MSSKTVTSTTAGRRHPATDPVLKIGILKIMVQDGERTATQSIRGNTHLPDSLLKRKRKWTNNVHLAMVKP